MPWVWRRWRSPRGGGPIEPYGDGGRHRIRGGASSDSQRTAHPHDRQLGGIHAAGRRDDERQYCRKLDLTYLKADSVWIIGEVKATVTGTETTGILPLPLPFIVDDGKGFHLFDSPFNPKAPAP